VEEPSGIKSSGPTNAPNDPLSVIIADDDPFVRRLVKEALQAAGIVVIAEASTGREAVELTLHYRPGAVLMDVVMPELDGITATRRILAERPDQLVILLTGSEDEDMALIGLRAGAAGFLTKDQAVESLPRALRAVVGGEAALSRAHTKRLIEHLRGVPERQVAMRPVHSPLTNREWEVLGLMAEQRSNPEIAATLFVSPATVRSHIKSILRKLGVRSRGEAVEVGEDIRAGRR
jgi:two-component system, NarL family, response regulator LiaR